MKSKDIFTSLLAIQDKHWAFFLAQGATIIDYLIIDWNSKPAKVTIINRTIPPELKADILALLPNVQTIEAI